jgi:ComF family protein
MLETIERTLDFFYPRRCPVCDRPVNAFELRGGRLKRGGLIHPDCHKKIRYIRGATCLKCGKPMEPGDDREYCDDCTKRKHYYKRGFSVFSYRTISGSIYRFKYMGRQEYAAFYGAATARLLGKKLKKLGVEAIVPVPMYRDKLRKRGYNQAERYAGAVSKELGIPMYTDLIERVKNTVPMKELDASRRRNNLKKAFNIVKNDVKFKCVLIIDDIYTTGSTIDEIAREFRMAGVSDVYFLTLSIGQTT